MVGATPLCRVGAASPSRFQMPEMMDDDAPNEAAEPVDEEPRDVSEEPRPAVSEPASMRRRAAVFVLLLGGVLAIRPLVEATPDERRFVVVVASPAEGVALTWRDGDGEVLRRLEQRFAGGVPAPLERVLRLPPGRYQLDITTERGGGYARETRTIDVEEDTSEVRVQVP